MYKIFFEDGTIFKGGKPAESKWNDMPLKPIKRIDYRLYGGRIILENFKSYNHLVERPKFFRGRCNLITMVILLARFEDKVKRVIFDIQHGQFYSKTSKYGEHHYDKSTGWKYGIESDCPKCEITKQKFLE